MLLVNCEFNLILTWSANCVISNSATNQATTFAITDARLYVPVITLSTHNDAKILQQIKSSFKRTINLNKCQPKVTIQAQNQNLDYLIDPSFQEVNRLFFLSFSDSTVTTRYRRYFLPNVQIEDYNVMIDGQSIFDQPVKTDVRTFDNIQKIVTGQGDNYTIGCLLDYLYFKDYSKMIAIDLRKQLKLVADPEAIQQINFTGNLSQRGGATVFFITE